MNLADFDPDVVVDARDCILGRVASNVAQRALGGDRVAVVHAEEAVITGDEEDVVSTYRDRAELGSDRGPAYPARPDGILKRSMRGMIPYKTERGREAFERVRVYMGNPNGWDSEVVEGTSLDRLSNIRFVHLGEVAEQLGTQATW